MVREWKKKEVKEVKNLLENNPVIGITNMHSIPGPQLQDIRKELHGKAKIRMSRKTLIKRAMDDVKEKDVEELKDYLIGETAFIFTDMNPFRLYSYLQENKSSAPARAGDIAPNDIVIPEGGTGIDPGPAIGKLQNAGIRTSIEDGEIYVADESKVVEEGEEITHEIAEALKMLGLEPMEIGLSLKAVWEDGHVFEPEDLDIDYEGYREDVKASYQRALNLSINAGYVTEENIELLVAKAWNEGLSVAMESEFPTEQTIEELLRINSLKAKNVESKVEEVS